MVVTTTSGRTYSVTFAKGTREVQYYSRGKQKTATRETTACYVRCIAGSAENLEASATVTRNWRESNNHKKARGYALKSALSALSATIAAGWFEPDRVEILAHYFGQDSAAAGKRAEERYQSWLADCAGWQTGIADIAKWGAPGLAKSESR